MKQGHTENLKQIPQNFMKVFKVDDVSQRSHLMSSYRKINIASEKVINYRGTSLSNHCF